MVHAHLPFSDCSTKEYEDRAVELATNPAKLQALTNKLKEVRLTCPLFDTARWVRFLCDTPWHVISRQ